MDQCCHLVSMNHAAVAARVCCLTLHSARMLWRHDVHEQAQAVVVDSCMMTDVVGLCRCAPIVSRMDPTRKCSCATQVTAGRVDS